MVVVGAAVAVVVGLPALRFRGLFLAVSTLGFALAVASWLFFQGWLVHESPETGSSLQLPRPTFFGIDFNEENRYYWLCLGVLLVTILMVYRLRRTGPGRAMLAVRDNEASAASLSLVPWRVKLTAFALSGAIASLAGFLYGGLLINFASDPSNTFAPGESLSFVVIAVFGGITSATGAVLGALWVEGIPRLLGEGYALLSSGLGVILILLLMPGGLATLVFALRDRFVAFAGRRHRAAPPTSSDEVTTSDREVARARISVGVAASGARDGAAPLTASNISVAFGGLRAVDDVTVHASAGEVLGLMGPNGAGKTTLFDVLSGSLRPAHGCVELDGRDVTRLPAFRRARLGLGRTYQQARLFADLTVLESVSVALERHHRSWLVPSMIGWPGSVRTERARMAPRRRGARAARPPGVRPPALVAAADRRASDGRAGVRHRAATPRAAARRADRGLHATRDGGVRRSTIGDVRRHLGATVVIIDHDVRLMRHLVDRLYVLAAGKVIAEGPPSILDSDTRVAEVYLGATVAARTAAPTLDPAGRV